MRVFIIEPTLILRVGHVSQCTYLFAQGAEELNNEVTIVSPKNSPTGLKIDEFFQVSRSLPNTYETFLIEGLKFEYKFKRLLHLLTFPIGEKRRNRANFFIDRFFWFTIYFRKTTIELEQLFKLHEINSQDRIVFPNADLLTVKATLNILNKMGKHLSPSLGLRFINVMENNGIPRIISHDSLFRQIGKMKNRGWKIEISAETESYRTHIARFTPESFVCEYPHEMHLRKKTPISKSGKITVGSLGSARPDKGFTRLALFIPKILAAFGPKIRVTIQEGVMSWGYEYEKTLSELRSYKAVSILPGYLPSLEMKRAIENCDILFMPYDEGTYEYRGSAMLFEAADRNIPMIVPSRTGLGEVVRKYGIGATFSSEADLISAFNSILQTEPSVFRARFAEYNNQRVRSFRRLIEG